MNIELKSKSINNEITASDGQIDRSNIIQSNNQLNQVAPLFPPSKAFSIFWFQNFLSSDPTGIFDEDHLYYDADGYLQSKRPNTVRKNVSWQYQGFGGWLHDQKEIFSAKEVGFISMIILIFFGTVVGAVIASSEIVYNRSKYYDEYRRSYGPIPEALNVYLASVVLLIIYSLLMLYFIFIGVKESVCFNDPNLKNAHIKQWKHVIAATDFVQICSLIFLVVNISCWFSPSSNKDSLLYFFILHPVYGILAYLVKCWSQRKLARISGSIEQTVNIIEAFFRFIGYLAMFCTLPVLSVGYLAFYYPFIVIPFWLSSVISMSMIFTVESRAWLEARLKKEEAYDILGIAESFIFIIVLSCFISLFFVSKMRGFYRNYYPGTPNIKINKNGLVSLLGYAINVSRIWILLQIAWIVYLLRNTFFSQGFNSVLYYHFDFEIFVVYINIMALFSIIKRLEHKRSKLIFTDESHVANSNDIHDQKKQYKRLMYLLFVLSLFVWGWISYATFETELTARRRYFSNYRGRNRFYTYIYIYSIISIACHGLICGLILLDPRKKGSKYAMGLIILLFLINLASENATDGYFYYHNFYMSFTGHIMLALLQDLLMACIAMKMRNMASIQDNSHVSDVSSQVPPTYQV